MESARFAEMFSVSYHLFLVKTLDINHSLEES
jgi:hypothetical protein